MTLQDVINDLNLKDIENIEYKYRSKEKVLNDLFIGQCAYKNNELVSLDNDDYCLDDEICEYDYDNGKLTVWIEVISIDNEVLRVYTSVPPQKQRIWFKCDILFNKWMVAELHKKQLTLYLDNKEFSVLYDIQRLVNYKWAYKV